MQVTNARKEISGLYSRLSQGGFEVIERNRQRDVVAVNAREYHDLLKERAHFAVEARFSDESVAVWIRDLPVHGEGDDLESALDELAGALIAYADVWEKMLRYASNHVGNRNYVRRVELAGSRDQVRAMLEADAAEEAEAYATAAGAVASPA